MRTRAHCITRTAARCMRMISCRRRRTHHVVEEFIMSWTRRSLLKSAAMGAAVSAVRPFTASAQAPAAPAAPASANTLPDEKQFPHLKVGICSYSLRSIPAAEALQDIKRLGVRNFSLKDVHLAQTSTPEQRR